MIAVIKKELKSYFLSPIGYVVVGIFLMAFSIFFFMTSVSQQNIDLTNLFYCVALYGLMIITPLITMWSFAGERRTGTDQLLLTSPVGMLGVVIAKFLAALILILIPVIFTWMYFAILAYFEMPDVARYLTSALGFLLLSMTYISFGILASSLTESPIIAGILTFAFVLGSTWLPTFSEKLQNLSLMDKFITFLYGQIDITIIIFFVSLTVLSILITMVVMQRRKSVK